MYVLHSHRRHGPPFVDAAVELDRALGETWLLRRGHLRGVCQDERLTHRVLGRAAGVTRARATFVLSGKLTVFVHERELTVYGGDLLFVPSGVEPLGRSTGVTAVEIEWDPDGALGIGREGGLVQRALGEETLAAAHELESILGNLGAPSRSELAGGARRVLELAANEGLVFDVEAATRELAEIPHPRDQELCDAIDHVLSHLEEGPHAVTLEERLGCSRRTLLRRTESLCRRYLLPGLAADDWRSVRDTYRLLVGTVFATHPAMTTRLLASMLGYASTEALCHAFANAGLPSPASLRRP